MTQVQSKFNEFVNYIESIGFYCKKIKDDLFGISHTVEYFVKPLTEETYLVIFFDGERIGLNFAHNNQNVVFLDYNLESVENLSKLIEVVECNLFSFVSLLHTVERYAVVLDDLLKKSTCCKIEIGTSDLSSDYVYLDLNEDGGRLYSKIKK
jgi:hypothetical protein